MFEATRLAFIDDFLIVASIRQSTVCSLQQQPQFHCPSFQKGSFSRKNIDRIGADDFFEAEVNNRSFQQSEKNRSEMKLSRFKSQQKIPLKSQTRISFKAPL